LILNSKKPQQQNRGKKLGFDANLKENRDVRESNYYRDDV
jgi:hypothetical protein